MNKRFFNKLRIKYTQPLSLKHKVRKLYRFVQSLKIKWGAKTSRLVSKPSFKRLHHFDLLDIWNPEFQVAFDSKVIKHGWGNRKWLEERIPFASNILCWSLADGSWTVCSTQKYRTLSNLNFMKYKFQDLKSCRHPLKCLLQCRFDVWITHSGCCASSVHSNFLSLSGSGPQVVSHYFWNAGQHPLKKKTVRFLGRKHESLPYCCGVRVWQCVLRGGYFWEVVPTSLPFSTLALISLTGQLAGQALCWESCGKVKGKEVTTRHVIWLQI